MINILVEIDRENKMARVDDGKGNIMEAELGDFHSGFYGFKHLPKFKNVEGLVRALQLFHKKHGNEVKINRQAYKFGQK